MFTGVMSFLKVKERYVHCTFSDASCLRSKDLNNIWTLDKQVSEDANEEEGRVTLNTGSHSANDEGGIALPADSELQLKKARRKTACCVCFGLEWVAHCLLPYIVCPLIEP
jgi:hypothetical protein